MQQRFLLQILLLAQHVSGTTMPIIRSARVLYSGCCLWYFVQWFSGCWSGAELRVMCPVCRMLAAARFCWRPCIVVPFPIGLAGRPSYLHSLYLSFCHNVINISYVLHGYASECCTCVTWFTNLQMPVTLSMLCILNIFKYFAFIYFKGM